MTALAIREKRERLGSCLATAPEPILDARVRAALARLPGRTGHLSFEIEGEEVRIEGVVPTYYAVQLITSALQRVEGVGRVVNHCKAAPW